MEPQLVFPVGQPTPIGNGEPLAALLLEGV
jgi:hypothetical protein